MKVRFVHYPSHPNPLFSIHFPRELPILARPYRWRSEGTISHKEALSDLGGRMASINAGKFSVELANPAATYQSYLETLAFLPGVVAILGGTRYSIRVEVARFFNPERVLRNVCRIVGEHFYPGQKINPEYNGQIVISGQEKLLHNTPPAQQNVKK
ncbi:MAG: hypothetical protein NZ807_10225 [Dehalococcoidia bacterium]|nr:hypothetical protein [Dehalococcoidia bacterium]